MVSRRLQCFLGFVFLASCPLQLDGKRLQWTAAMVKLDQLFKNQDTFEKIEDLGEKDDSEPLNLEFGRNLNSPKGTMTTEYIEDLLRGRAEAFSARPKVAAAIYRSEEVKSMTDLLLAEHNATTDESEEVESMTDLLLAEHDTTTDESEEVESMTDLLLAEHNTTTDESEEVESMTDLLLGEHNTTTDESEELESIADLLRERVGEFSVLVGIMEITRFIDTVYSEGVVTLFAPTNDAFATVTPDDCLQKYFDREWGGIHLSALLAFHSGNDFGEVVLFSDMVDNVTTFTPIDHHSLDDITFSSDPAQLSSRGTPFPAQIIEADQIAANGVYHVIDQVLIPRFFRSNALQTVAVLDNAETFSTFLELVAASGLAYMFEDSGPLTIFMPPNNVFEVVEEGLPGFVNYLKANQPLLRVMLLHHIIAHTFMYEGADHNHMSEANYPLRVIPNDSGFTVNQVRNHEDLAPVLSSNAIIHVIQGILVPPEILNEILEAFDYND